jgi:predicted nucleotidyltransferase
VSEFGRILEDLNQGGVRYVLIGGIALIRHGVVRATRDVDAVFDSSVKNVDRIRSLIHHWGATRPDGTDIDLDSLSGDRSIHLSTPHGDLDLVSERTAGIQFDRLRSRADVRKVDGIEAPICSLADLVRMKRAVGRERDLADLADLEAGHGDLPDGE